MFPQALAPSSWPDDLQLRKHKGLHSEVVSGLGMPHVRGQPAHNPPHPMSLPRWR